MSPIKLLEVKLPNIFGNSADDTHTFQGNITASGNISTSGDFYGEDYFIAGKQVLVYVGFDSDRIRFGNATQKPKHVTSLV